MVTAFAEISDQTYDEILSTRIPSQDLFLATQMLCSLINAFRGSQLRSTIKDFDGSKWASMQEFVHKALQYNVELDHLIRETVLSKYYIGKLKANQLSKHLDKLVKINENYFGLKTKMDILAPFRSAKTKSIVNACFCIVRFVLNRAGKKSLLNLRKDA